MKSIFDRPVCPCKWCQAKFDNLKVGNADNVTPRLRAADPGRVPVWLNPGSGHSGLCAPEQSAVTPSSFPEETKSSGDNLTGIVWIPGMTLAEAEKWIIVRALEHHRGNRTHTAKALGMSIRTLRIKISQYRSEAARQAT